MPRMKYLNLTPDVLLALCKGKAMVCEGLPADAELARVNYGLGRDFVQLVVSSVEFEEVPDGAPIPEIMITLSTPPQSESDSEE